MCVCVTLEPLVLHTGINHDPSAGIAAPAHAAVGAPATTSDSGPYATFLDTETDTDAPVDAADPGRFPTSPAPAVYYTEPVELTQAVYEVPVELVAPAAATAAGTGTGTGTGRQR